MEIATNIWTIHLSETRKFIEKIIEKNNFHVIELYEFEYPLRIMPFHSKRLV